MSHQLTQENLTSLQGGLFDRIHKTGEEVKNDLPNSLRFAIKHKAWEQFTDVRGKPFSNIVEWLEYGWPGGVGMGRGRHVLNLEDLIQLCKGAPDVHRELTKHQTTIRPVAEAKR